MTVQHEVVPSDQTIDDFDYIEGIGLMVGADSEQLSRLRRLYETAVEMFKPAVFRFMQEIVSKIRGKLEEDVNEMEYNPAGSLSSVHDIISNVIVMMTTAAIYAERIDVLDWMYERGIRFGDNELAAAIADNNLDMITTLIDDFGTPCTERALNLAARYGYLEMVKLMHECGCALTSETMTNAEYSGNIELLNWLRRKVGRVHR